MAVRGLKIDALKDDIRLKDKMVRFIKATKLKNIAVLSSGVFIAQAIGIAVQPIATRLYTVEMFGQIALISSIVTMFSSLTTLKYDQSIIVAKTEKEANVLTALSIYIGLLTTAIFSVGLIIYNFFYPNTFLELGLWIYITIPLVLITALDQVASKYNNRHEHYKLMASVSMLRSIISGIVKIVLGLLQSGFLGLALSSLVASSFGIKRHYKYILKNINEIKEVKKSELILAAKKYKNQPLFSAPGFFVNTYSYSVLPIFITLLYGVKETGFFSQTMLILGLPLSLVSVSVGHVFFKNASQERNEQGNFHSSFKNTTRLLILISIIPFTVLWLWAEPLFSFAFGTEWVRSGTFVKLLIPMYFVRFTVTALTEALIIAEKQKLKLFIQCIFVFLASITFVVSKYLGLSIEQFLLIINYSYLFNYLFIFFVVKLESKRKVAPA